MLEGLEGLDLVDEGIGWKSEAKSTDGAMVFCYRNLSNSKAIWSTMRWLLIGDILKVSRGSCIVHEVGLIRVLTKISDAEKCVHLRCTLKRPAELHRALVSSHVTIGPPKFH